MSTDISIWHCDTHGAVAEPIFVGGKPYCSDPECSQRLHGDHPEVEHEEVAAGVGAAIRLTGKPPRSIRRPPVGRDTVIAAVEKIGSFETANEIAKLALPADVLADDFDREPAMDALRTMLRRLTAEGLLEARLRPLYRFGKRTVHEYRLAEHLRKTA